jgi:hypothetical protein
LADLGDDSRFEGPQKLKPLQSRLANAIVIGIFALIWNGVISIFVINMLRAPGWFQMVVLAPFVLAGAGLIVATIHQLLALTNPRVEVALSNGAVALGHSIDVAWQLSGRTNRIRDLAVSVQGTEHATYTRGSSTYTDKSVFQTIELYSGADPSEMTFGTRIVQIPLASMHTFRGNKNKILWTVNVRARIPFWPDIDESFEFLVKPIEKP